MVPQTSVAPGFFHCCNQLAEVPIEDVEWRGELAIKFITVPAVAGLGIAVMAGLLRVDLAGALLTQLDQAAGDRLHGVVVGVRRVGALID